MSIVNFYQEIVMDVQNKVTQALNKITSQKEMDDLFRRLTFEEHQAIMEDSEIETENIETQEITLVTGCEVEFTLETIIFKE
jgi:hypothetical protein